ncbi:hypothetical protein ON010_g9451 [Phytophthora cinnamomi]|nr:hypothetical protein ON010_g9451 [Phytophthora cinnamomi]
MFVSLNRFERKKNVDLAIKALVQIKHKLSPAAFRNVKLVIAGGYDSNNPENLEHLQEFIREVARCGLEDHVEFCTSVTDTMKKELLASARAAVYTPSYEHFGIVPVEAMALGTLVIAVNSGGPMETVKNGTDESFADAMLQLLGSENDARAAAMGIAGKERALTSFSFEAFSDQLMELVIQKFGTTSCVPHHRYTELAELAICINADDGRAGTMAGDGGDSSGYRPAHTRADRADALHCLPESLGSPGAGVAVLVSPPRGIPGILSGAADAKHPALQRFTGAPLQRFNPFGACLWVVQVDGGSVTLKPVEFPSVHKDGITARFVADANAAGKRPMLTNVVQRNRRIYTLVTVKWMQSCTAASIVLTSIAGEDSGSASGDRLVLRSYSYLKEFGEWKTPTLPEKRMLAAASVGSRRGRFDLCSQDGSVVLELEVPSGTDAQTDYYLVKQVSVSIHMQELLQQHFHLLRPIRSLPEPTRRGSCSISIAFRSMTGSLIAGFSTPGYITVEQQDGDEDEAAHEERPRQRTGVEKFEIVTYRADSTNIKIALPDGPGYAWIEIRSTDEGASSRRSSLYFYAVALHYGSRQVSEQGDLRAVQLNWLPGVLESFPTLESRHRRCLKGNLRIVASSHAGTLQELTIVAQRLPAARLESIPTTPPKLPQNLVQENSSAATRFDQDSASPSTHP